MAALERVMQLKQEGVPESQIPQSLREEGFSPKEINEALSQSNIKSTLTNNPEAPPEQAIPTPYPEVTTEFSKHGITKEIPAGEMQPSIMPGTEPQPPPLPSQQVPGPTEQPIEQYGQEQYPQQGYDYYPEYQPADIETMNDIAEQIVEEKIAKLKKQVSEVIKFKNETSLELKNMLQRLEKLENSFHQLQTAILGKIGDYGKDINKLAKEMQATQESFSKMINPVLDKKRTETETIATSESEKEEPRKGRRKKTIPDFESYLR